MKLKTGLITSILVLLTVSLRLPFMSRYLYFVDSVIYSLAMERFDVAHGLPAAPGCLGYVLSGKWINLLAHDANKSFVYLGLIFSALSSGMIFLLGKEWYGYAFGFIAALLLITSPLVWFFGEIAMPVTANLFFGLLVAYFCYKTMNSRKLSPLIFSAISLGIGAGFRQDLLIFILPLWLWSLSRRPVREITLAIGILFLTSLLWFIPSSISSGGAGQYLYLCRERIFGQSGHFSYMTKANILAKKMHIYNYALALMTSLFFGLVPLLYYLSRIFNPRTIIKDRIVRFLLIWILPSFIYMNLVGGNRSYIFVHLPAVFISLGLALRYMARDFTEAGLERLGKISMGFILVLILTINIFFYLYDPPPHKKWTTNTWFRSSDIKRHDQLLAIKLNYIKEHFSPRDSIIIAGGLRQTYWPLLYYLPAYRVYQPNAVYWREVSFMEMAFEHRRENISGPIFKIPSAVKNIIFFDEDIYPYIKSPGPLEEVSLEHGYSLYHLPVTRERNIRLALHQLEVF